MTENVTAQGLLIAAAASVREARLAEESSYTDRLRAQAGGAMQTIGAIRDARTLVIGIAEAYAESDPLRWEVVAVIARELMELARERSSP